MAWPSNGESITSTPWSHTAGVCCGGRNSNEPDGGMLLLSPTIIFSHGLNKRAAYAQPASSLLPHDMGAASNWHVSY